MSLLASVLRYYENSEMEISYVICSKMLLGLLLQVSENLNK